MLTQRLWVDSSTRCEGSYCLQLPGTSLPRRVLPCLSFAMRQRFIQTHSVIIQKTWVSSSRWSPWNCRLPPLCKWHHQSCLCTQHKIPQDRRSHVISGFRREVDETCALLGYYAASSSCNYHYSLNYHNSLRNRSEDICSLKCHFGESNAPKICQAISVTKCYTYDLH